MEGDQPRIDLDATEMQLPKVEHLLPAPELAQETSHEMRQAQPTLAALVAAETLKKNPNSQVRQMAEVDPSTLPMPRPVSMDTDAILRQVQQAAERNNAQEALEELSHEAKDEPSAYISRQDDNSVVDDDSTHTLLPDQSFEDEQQAKADLRTELRDLTKTNNYVPTSVSMYQQAILVGLTAATAILAIFITLKLTQ